MASVDVWFELLISWIVHCTLTSQESTPPNNNLNTICWPVLIKSKFVSTGYDRRSDPVPFQIFEKVEQRNRRQRRSGSPTSLPSRCQRESGKSQTVLRAARAGLHFERKIVAKSHAGLLQSPARTRSMGLERIQSRSQRFAGIFFRNPINFVFLLLLFYWCHFSDQFNLSWNR